MMTNQFWVTFLYQRTEWQLIKPYVQGYRAAPLDEGIFLPGDFYSNAIYIANHWVNSKTGSPASAGGRSRLHDSGH